MDEQKMIRVGDDYHAMLVKMAEQDGRTLRKQMEYLIAEEKKRRNGNGNGHDEVRNG